MHRSPTPGSVQRFCRARTNTTPGIHAANFWWAPSRLYQNEVLQENMRLTTFFKLYKTCILLHRCNLKNLAKIRFEKSGLFVKFQQKNCKCCKICKILPFFKKLS